MDTNIVGIVFDLDKDKYKKLRKQNPNTATVLAAQAMLVFHGDNNHEYIDMTNYADSAKLKKVQEYMNKASAARVNGEIVAYYSDDIKLIDSVERATGHKDFLPRAERDRIVEKVVDNALSSIDVDENQNENSDLKKKVTVGALAAAGLLALAGGAGAGYAMGQKDDSKNANPEALNRIVTEIGNTDVNIDNISTPISLEGQDWLYYVNEALDSDQKSLFINQISPWLNEVNAKEDWERATLSQEQMTNYKFDDPECIYGFTADEAYALALRFNEYTNDQYVSLTGGKEIDTIDIMNDSNSQSNGALSKIISYYVNSDDCNLNISALLNFNEKEQAKIVEFETLFREYKALDNEKGKEKEAETKMQEIKKSLVNYAMDIDSEQVNAKSYILRTFLPAASIISQMHQYQDKIPVTLYDTKTQTNVDKDIKTALFDEITMRTLVLGYNETAVMGAFDSEAFLEEHNISTSRYNLLNTDVARSIADQSCGTQATRLDEANKYIAAQRSEDLAMETAYAGSQNIDLSTVGAYDNLNNVRSHYDQLVNGTFDANTIIELLNKDLMDKNIYPKNVEYFTQYLITEKMIEYKNTHGVTQGKVGDIIKETYQQNVKVTEADLTAPNVTVRNHAGEVVSASEAMAEARQEDAKNSTSYDYAASTPEESKQAQQQAQASQGYVDRTALLQNVYNATYNHFYGQDVLEATTGYDPSWATSSDPEIVSRHNSAKASAENRKALEEQAAQFNQQQQSQAPVIDEQFKNAEIYEQPQAPVESQNNTTQSSTNADVINSAQQDVSSQATQNSNAVESNQQVPDFDYLPGFEDAEIEGDIEIGNSNSNEQISFYTTDTANDFSQDSASSTSNDNIPTIDASQFGSLADFESYIENLSDEEFNSLIEGYSEDEPVEEAGFSK